MSTSTHTLCIGLTPALQELREFERFACGEVNRASAVLRSAAGKGVNVGRVLCQLGGNPLVLGFAGGDTGRAVRASLKQDGVPQEFTTTRAPTRVCTTILDCATGATTELVEEAALPTPSEWRRFFAAVERNRRRANRMVIAGALMPGAKPDVYRQLADMGLPLVIDSQKEPLLVTLPTRPLLVKLNVHELSNTLERRLTGQRAILAAGRELVARGARNAVVTDGAKGAWLVSPRGVWHCRPPRIDVVNPIGSGDAVTAGICRGIDRRRSMPEAVRLGIACGTANALTRAAGTVMPEDIRRIEPRVRVRRVDQDV